MITYVVIDKQQRPSTTKNVIDAAVAAMAGDMVLRNRGPDCYLIDGGFCPVLTPSLWRRARAERPHLMRAALEQPQPITRRTPC